MQQNKIINSICETCLITFFILFICQTIVIFEYIETKNIVYIYITIGIMIISVIILYKFYKIYIIERNNNI